MKAMKAGVTKAGKGIDNIVWNILGQTYTPKQVSEILRRHPEVAKARLVVAGEVGADAMSLKCEAKERPAGLAAALVATIREVTKLRGEVELLAPGSLPNDGKVIDDTRKYG